MGAPQSRYWRPKQLDAGGFQPEISSFGLSLAAEGKAAKTVRTYTEAVAWFAAAHLLTQTGRTGWEQVGKHDVQQWMVWLLDRYSAAYASNQFRALQQFFKILASAVNRTACLSAARENSSGAGASRLRRCHQGYFVRDGVARGP
jgi:Phage integrase, N-terminal SAM-like domain